MLYQYHCGCCEKVVSTGQKSCSSCGSHNIRTPYGFWMFCIFSCLVAAIVFKVVHVYLADNQTLPVQQSFLDALHQTDNKRSN